MNNYAIGDIVKYKRCDNPDIEFEIIYIDELNRATCKRLDVSIPSFYCFNDEDLIYIRRQIFNMSIVLPIKQEFADKILDGTKKYEYRKRLCKKPIDKIYIYVTAPIKKVVGEVEVLDKIKEDKSSLWDKTDCESGITKDFYDKYFSNIEFAEAYKLGKIVKYNQYKTLSDFGIDYVPQSFCYIKEKQICSL